MITSRFEHGNPGTASLERARAAPGNPEAGLDEAAFVHTNRGDQFGQYRLDGGGLTMGEGGVELFLQRCGVQPARTVRLVLPDVRDLVAPG